MSDAQNAESNETNEVMLDYSNSEVIVATFPSEGAAESAVAALKTWDEASEDIKLGSVGTITYKNGKVKTHLGRKAGRGAVVGSVIGLLVAFLSGPIGWLGGLVGGAALGGITGAFFKKSTSLTKEEVEAIGQELQDGAVAVVVACDAHEMKATASQLEEMGGKVRNYEVPEVAVVELKQVALDEGHAEWESEGA